MLKRIWNAIRAWDREARQSFDGDVSTPEGRRAAMWHFNFFDHAFLRHWWTNFEEIAPGVYRSNQPGPNRIKRYQKMGIKSVLSLRGESAQAFFKLEEQATADAGIDFYTVRLNARATSPKKEFLALFELFKTMEGPWLMHCKSGADRAGLASALYILWSGGSVDDARAQLSWRYMHLDNKHTGICDYILETYAKDTANEPLDIETWFKKKYDRDAIQAGFDIKIGRA